MVDRVTLKHYNLVKFAKGGETLNDDLLTIEQVADKLQLHPDTIRRYIRERKLRAVRISATTIRVRQSEVDRFLKERETDGGDSPTPTADQ
jgi:excisionase family DNA binding protein